jgi:hypothetical protein
MAAYPFQPLSNQRLKQLSRSIKESKHNANTNSLQKDSTFPDSVISKTTRPVSDQACNHPQADNS